jgi:hypothetical protein
MASDREQAAEAVKYLKHLLKDVPVEVLGHLEAPGLCCGNSAGGTVALVKVEQHKEQH